MLVHQRVITHIERLRRRKNHTAPALLHATSSDASAAMPAMRRCGAAVDGFLASKRWDPPKWPGSMDVHRCSSPQNVA